MAMPLAFIGFFLWILFKELGMITSIFVGFILGINFLFSYLLKAPTKEARKLLDEIESFEEYLKVAEEDRLNLENPPERTPELFEKFLPYALALGLGLDQRWSNKFKDVLKQAAIEQGLEKGEAYKPSFYRGPAFRSSMFSDAATAAVGTAITGALATASTRPASSGSSYSSSGGGGSSGGGSGGGGW